MNTWALYNGSALGVLTGLPEASAQACVTSPPYFGLRDYGTASWSGGDPECQHLQKRGVQGVTGQRADRTHTERMPFRESCGHCGAVRLDSQIGLESSPKAYVAALVAVFEGVRRVLRDDGVLWLNIGDSYAGSGRGGTEQPGGIGSTARVAATTRFAGDDRNFNLKPKDLIGIPWMLAFALRDDGWYLRSDCLWIKPNPMPESVTDRPTKSHEYVFLLTKSQRYTFHADAIREKYAESTLKQFEQPYDNHGTKDYDAHGVQDPSDVKARIVAKGAGHGANARTAWTIPTEPSGAFEVSRRVRVAWDDSDGDKTRTTSPDCPIHGDQAVQAAKALCGERVIDRCDRISRTDNDLVEALVGVELANAHGLDARDVVHVEAASLDVPRVHSANLHSTESRRTVHGPETIPACSASGETSSRTDDTSSRRKLSETLTNIAESKTLGRDDLTAAVSAQMAAGNIGKCSCEYYRIVTEKTGHFAVMPKALARKCIVSGCASGETVLDPFAGMATTGVVALEEGRNFVGIELSAKYHAIARERLAGVSPLLASEIVA